MGNIQQEKNIQWETDQVIFDQKKCVGCGRCVATCPVGFLRLNENKKTSPVINDKTDCTNCAQCVLNCPVRAINGRGEFSELKELETILSNRDLIKVAQFAPSVRVSLGESFGLESGNAVTGKIIAALKKMGFDYVFDTASGADFTTMEEAMELKERLESGQNLPAMSSCCPAWVKFLEFNYPEFVSHLCTSRSPQVMLGGVIKKYWSKIKSVDLEKIYVVSIMPCVAKKFEIEREELKIDGLKPVDQVLTARELAQMIKDRGIDFVNIKDEKGDTPLGEPSGAGVIYGASGGVFESALRTAYFRMTGEELPFDAVKEIRGTEKGIKEKVFNVGGKEIKICVVNGLRNAKKIMEELKSDPQKYSAIEVMACPGGCVGGGGQIIPTNEEIIKKRASGLYNIDDQKAFRRAHQNPDIQKIYQDFFNQEETRRNILHTRFAPRNKSSIKY